MVNLMAMILLAGPQSFLWTFAFQPKRLEDSYGKFYSTSEKRISPMHPTDISLGFGSVYRQRIHHNGVHYDCGCIISENGQLIIPFGINDLTG